MHAYLKLTNAQNSTRLHNQETAHEGSQLGLDVLYPNSTCAVVMFQPVKSIIHALGHNRARQRDKLAHLLEEFAALQDEVKGLISS